MIYPVTCRRCDEKVSLFDWLAHLRDVHDEVPSGLTEVKWGGVT